MRAASNFFVQHMSWIALQTYVLQHILLYRRFICDSLYKHPVDIDIVIVIFVLTVSIGVELIVWWVRIKATNQNCVWCSQIVGFKNLSRASKWSMHTIETEILFMTENISLLVSRYHRQGQRVCVSIHLKTIQWQYYTRISR